MSGINFSVIRSLWPAANDLKTPCGSGFSPARLKIRAVWLASAALALLCTAAAVGFLLVTQKHPASAASVTPPPALTVATATVSRQPYVDGMLVDGSINPWQKLVIGSKINGLAVVELAVDEGSQVEAGQVLARLDRSLLSAQLDQAKAQIAHAESAFKFAKADGHRAEELLKGGNLSVQMADQRLATRESAEADLALAQAQYEAIQVQLEQTEIRAPCAGLVSKRMVELGTIVSNGMELFNIVRDGILELNAEVPDQQISRVKPGASVRMHAPNGSVLTGVVRAVAPEVNADTRNGIVRIRLPRDVPFRVGQFVSAEIVLDERKELTVPEPAVRVKDGQAQVFVVGNDEQVTARAVKIAQYHDGKAAIYEGLSEGEEIVTVGANFLRGGEKVQVTRGLLQ